MSVLPAGSVPLPGLSMLGLVTRVDFDSANTALFSHRIVSCAVILLHDPRVSEVYSSFDTCRNFFFKLDDSNEVLDLLR